MTLHSKTAALMGLFSFLAIGATEAKAEMIYGITDAGGLLRFDSATPGSSTSIGPVTGILAGQTLRAIDFRPADGLLYGISSIPAAVGGSNGLAQLYSINLSTGAATTIGSTFGLASGSTRVSIDFNPVVDRLRVVTGDGFNLRVNPNNGTIAGTDTNLAYSPTDPNASNGILMGDVAYTNNVAGATSTTLYGYEFLNDRLVTIGSVGGTPTSPNAGQLFTVGSSGIVAGSASLGFDISGATGIGYLNVDTASSLDSIYSVNLGTGALTSLGTTGLGILDISVQSAPVPEPATMAALGLGVMALIRRRKKS